MESTAEELGTQTDKLKNVNKLKASGSSDEKEEKAPDSSDTNGLQKSKSTKAKKRKKPKDVTAPRQPLTGLLIRSQLHK